MKQPTRSIPILPGDDSQTGSARRQAMAQASALDFSELRCGQLGIVVTELARNVSLHGGGGELLLTPWTCDGQAGLDVLALDTGPGIENIAEAMTDGYSTGGTAGTGLGAVRRLAETFQVFTEWLKGTVVFARVLATQAGSAGESSPREGSINLPIAGETVCGDAWQRWSGPGRDVYIMADGLGHGPIAHEAAEEAMRCFDVNKDAAPGPLLQAVHRALGKTRGAAVAVAEVLPGKKVLTYVGAGNIASSIVTAGQARSLVSMNGTPGHTMGTVQEFTYPWTAESLLIMHSDGLATRWSLDKYPGLASRHPSLIAGVLFRDFSRRRDDVTILVSTPSA